MKIASDLEAAVLKYIAHIKADYAGWGERSAIRETMIKEFDAGISYEIHRKFIKVITGQAGGNTSVHSFITLNDDGKFKRGDILMAASWKAPAKNFARGNVLTGKFERRVSWTGAH
jgi:O-glycosyl hydrolase